MLTIVTEPKLNKYIFLDIDGPMKPGRCYLCPEKSADTFGGWDPLAVAAINRICEKTGASVVFNTTWNLYNIIDIGAAQGIKANIAGKTEYPQIRDRLNCIEMWLRDNEQTQARWVAIDDCKILHKNAILIDPDNGITAQNYRDACSILGNPDAFMVLV